MVLIAFEMLVTVKNGAPEFAERRYVIIFCHISPGTPVASLQVVEAKYPAARMSMSMNFVYSTKVSSSLLQK